MKKFGCERKTTNLNILMLLVGNISNSMVTQTRTLQQELISLKNDMCLKNHHVLTNYSVS